MNNELIVLNTGVEMPSLGFGVFQTPPEGTVAAVDEALRVGYRHIDTAAAYLNEREVGQGIERSDGPRDEIFVETKVWISDYGYEETLHAFDKSAGKLGVDQIDMLICTGSSSSDRSLVHRHRRHSNSTPQHLLTKETVNEHMDRNRIGDTRNQP